MSPVDLTHVRGLLGSGRFAEAERSLREAMRGGPLPPAAQILLGAALARQGRGEEAVAVLDAALKEDGAALEGWNWLSVAHRDLGRYAKAQAACEEALRLRPDDLGARFNLGLCFVAAGDFERGAASLEQVLRASPQNAQVLHNLGVAYQGLGRDDEAEACLRRAAALAPEVPEPKLALGMLLWRKGRSEETLKIAGELLQARPDSEEAHFLASKAHMTLGHASESRKHLEAILERNPNHGLALGTLGTQRQVEGDFEGARAMFLKALALNAGEGLAFWGLVQSGARGDFDLDSAAVQAESPAIGLEARSYFHYGLARLQEDAGEYEKAFQSYGRANALAAKLAFGSRAFDAAGYEERLFALRRLFTSAVCADHDQADLSARPIFVIGMIRSGTTLMEQILSAHPDVCPGGEIRFWLDQGARAIDLAAGRIDKAFSGRLAAEYLSRLQELCPDGSRVTDKMPDNLLMAGLIHRLLPQAKFVLMRRHPIDNCLSIYTTPFAFPPEYAHSLENIARAFSAHARVAEHWMTVLPPETMLEVSYEQLARDPEPVVRTVLEHWGLAWNDACLRPQENRRSVNTPSLWQARQEIYTSSVERWRRFEPWLGDLSNLIRRPTEPA